MPRSSSSSKRGDEAQIQIDSALEPHVSFGESKDQRSLERQLVRKLDLRISMLLVLNMLNNVRDIRPLLGRKY